MAVPGVPFSEEATVKTALSCALCVVVFSCWATAADDSSLTVQGGQAHIRTVGGAEAGAWNLWSNGEWGDFVAFAQGGAYDVSVQCFGSPAGGVWPTMAFSVDGVVRDTVTVGSPKAADHVFRITVEPGHHRLTVSFLNDTRTEAEDRNLYIVQLAVTGVGGLPAPALSTEAQWRAQWDAIGAKAEEQTLARAAQAIETHRKRDVVVRVVSRDDLPVEGANVAVQWVQHEFLFGCNIFMFDRFSTPGDNELYKTRFRDLFNAATTGFYWRSYEPQQGRPEYDRTDRVVAWCAQHGIRVKGHPLLWACESGIPRWSSGQPPADARKRRVEEIMTRYAGKIEFWEVVNEPSHLPDLPIDDPYRWARAADAGAQLIVNDYQVLADGCPPFLQLLQGAASRGVPFDGIGIQAHEPRTMRFPLDRVWAVLDQYAALGRKLYITEFTPTSGGEGITGSHVTGVWDEASQADYAAKFYTVCFAHPAVAGITWWDLCDAGAWLPGGGLLRKDLSPKPAYEALKKLITQDWVTNAAGKTGPGGVFPFRGFCGHYLVRVTCNGTTVEKSLRVGPQEQQRIDIVLE